MTEIVLLYILTAMTAAGLILSILLLQKYGAAQTEIAALKAEQQRLAALQTEETRRSAQETAQALQNMQTNIQTNLQASMQTFGEMVSTNQKDSAENLDKRLADLNTRFSHMAVENEQKLENIRISMEKKIGQLNEDNQKQLEQMRQTVDEKLQKTLEERISKSFQLVSERLEQVYKGLGEMDPEQLWETTMEPATRTLLQVNIDDAVEAERVVSELMGEQVEPRKEFIQKHARDVRFLDI